MSIDTSIEAFMKAADQQRASSATAVPQQRPGETATAYKARLSAEARIVREARRAQQDAEKAAKDAAKAAKREARRIEIEESRARGEALPPPSNPVATGRVLIAKHVPHHGDFPLWTHWRGDFYQRETAKWSTMADSDVRAWAYRVTENCVYEAVTPWGEQVIEDWAPTSAKVKNLMEAIGTGILNRPWRSEPDDGPETIHCENGAIDVITGDLLEHDPRVFNLFALPFAYEPDAQCPEWERFLDVVFSHDPGQIRLLQQWFGYVVSGRTDLQKAASLVGPPRCGKGTIDRALKGIVGDEAFCSPKIGHLTSEFGRESLIGKRLITFSDVRWNVRDAAEAIPILLAITGEDADTVPRKNRTDWTGKLPGRIMLVSNDTPTFTDSSGAMAGRLLNITFRRSFLGKEDTKLGSRIMAELPGILRWALEGLRDLNESGEFCQTESSAAMASEIERDTSPEWAFVQDTCTPAKDGRERLDVLYEAYTNWCTSEGRDHPLTKARFSRSLRSACGHRVEGFDIDRKTLDGMPKQQWVFGISLNQRHRSSSWR